MSMRQFYSAFVLSLICFACGFLLSCTDSGGSVSSTAADPGADNSGITLKITEVQNLTSATWIADTNGKIYLNSSTVHIKGDCTRGVAEISATVNGNAVTESGTCQADGTFTWDKVFSSSTPALGTDYAIIFQASGANSLPLSGVTVQKTLNIDRTAPTAPVLNSVSGCSLSVGVWVCNFSAIQITGSWSGAEDVVSLQSPGNGITVKPTSTTFTYDFNLVEGQSRILDFTLTDRAGNISGSGSLQVVYSPSVSVLASSVLGGGTIGFAGGPLNTASSMFGNVSGFSAVNYDLNSGLPQNQKVQLLIGPVAIGAEKLKP